MRSLPDFEEASLGGLGFCSLYCLLCFDHGVYGEIIISKLTNDGNKAFNIFNNRSLPYLRPPCKHFTPPRLRIQALESIDRDFEDYKSTLTIG